MHTLADVEKNVKEFDEIFDQGTQVELTAAEGEIFLKWGMLLNEIYADLKKTLPPDDMSKLRVEQRDWLEFRDEKATEDAYNIKADRWKRYSIKHISTVNKRCCYEFVDLYMK